MGRQKLTECKIRRIKKMLLSGDYTKKQIGDIYGVTPSHICKINKGMKEPNHLHARWSDIN
jgi:DNA-directed RNA polymerase specialized sigma subunit